MKSMRKLIFAIVFLIVASNQNAWSQITVGGDDEEFALDYNKPKQYEIGGISVSGIKFLDNYALIKLTGLEIGDKIQIPGDKISGAIKKLWVQGLFDDIQINITKVDGQLIFFDIALKERPRLSRFSFVGIKKSEADDIRERIKLVSGKVVNENLINNTKNSIQKYYTEKGYLNAKVDIIESVDSIMTNSVLLKIKIDKNKKVKIEKINIIGNTALSARKVK